MTYYETLAEDLIRAKQILAAGREDYTVSGSEQQKPYVIHGRTILAVDIFAAYQLLESFVQVIERQQDALTALVSMRHEAETLLEKIGKLVVNAQDQIPG